MRTLAGCYLRDAGSGIMMARPVAVSTQSPTPTEHMLMNSASAVDFADALNISTSSPTDRSLTFKADPATCAHCRATPVPVYIIGLADQWTRRVAA